MPYRALLPALLWWGLSLWLLLKPAGAPSAIPYFDKIGHFMLFGVQAALLGWGLHRVGVPRPRLTAWLGCVLWAGLSEGLQAWLTVDRAAEWLDALADVAGAGAAVLVLGRCIAPAGKAV
ncbi:VanZ family protein [Pseudogulbenkiania sp. MAI-1]|uniref:VanZ family protein n=1 Tax=Pseudogulbenkiania sp. MAI-1 TaxID=990370 RepID=UPI00045E9655|nr:VanZ family protein [Pseudogulbenkiania sp. MAI-1]